MVVMTNEQLNNYLDMDIEPLMSRATEISKV